MDSGWFMEDRRLLLGKFNYKLSSIRSALPLGSSKNYKLFSILSISSNCLPMFRLK